MKTTRNPGALAGGSLTVLALLLTLSSQAVMVTFRINMNGLTGFNTPEVNGTFNNWCGICNQLSDANGDGIWQTTIDLPPGLIEYKFTFDNWAGQENLSSAHGCTVGSDGFSNRFHNVQNDVVLDVACWGLCDCIPPDNGNWALYWADEFNGNELDMDTWSFELGATGWGNNEWQNYTNSPDNLQVANGRLSIIARQVGQGHNGFTSARIITLNKFDFQYGKVEARIKVPMGQGIWPAFWMMGANWQEVGWPHCGEIDIMERVNNEHFTHSAVHWFYNTGHTYRTSSIPYNPIGYNLYQAIWNEDGVTFMLNDHPFWHLPFAAGNNTAAIFQNPFFFLLNVAVGGNWPGYPNATTPFPAIMEVDYIRVFKEADVSSAQEEPELAEPIIYPVPFNNQLQIDFREGNHLRHIHVYNALGNLLLTTTSSDLLITLQSPNWSSGVYIVEVQQPGYAPARFKVVKD